VPGNPLLVAVPVSSIVPAKIEVKGVLDPSDTTRRKDLQWSLVCYIVLT